MLLRGLGAAHIDSRPVAYARDATPARWRPLKVVNERLGHAQASITLDAYTHVIEDMQERAVDCIDATLFGQTFLRDYVCTWRQFFEIHLAEEYNHEG
jgi:hypothetical protein